MAYWQCASAITVPAGSLESSQFPKVNFSMLKKNPAASLICAITEDLRLETADITPEIDPLVDLVR
jgi:hypothetical protein